MKLQVRFIDQKNCYVSLPRGIASLAGSNYSDSAICRGVKLTRMNKQKLFVGYASGVSKNENEIEISSVFAEQIGIEDGEPIDVEIINNVSSEIRLELQLTNYDSYEMVCHMREKFEEILLNQISILYDGIRFPCYFSESQYVVFQYTDPRHQQQQVTPITCKMIHPQCELVILPPPESAASNKSKVDNNNDFDDDDDEEEDISQVKFLKLRTAFRSLENNPSLLVSRSVYERYKFQANKLYKISLERIVKDSEYVDFKMFLSKLQQAQKQKTSEDKSNGGGNRGAQSANVAAGAGTGVPSSSSTNSHSIITIGMAEDIDNTQIVMNEFLQHALQIDQKSIVAIDLHFELANIKENRIVQFTEFLSPQTKIKLVFRQIYGVNGKGDLAKDHSCVVAQIIARYLAGKQDIYYNDQIFNFRGNYYVLKIVEFKQDTKEILKTIIFENNNSSLQNSLSNGMKGGNGVAAVGAAGIKDSLEKSPAEIIDENQVLALQLTPQIIFSSQQEYFADFHENEIIAINKLVKSKIHVDAFAKIKLGIYDVIYAKESKLLREFFEESEILENRNRQSVLQITGKSQSGKTYSVEYLSQRFPNYHIEVIDFAELQEQVLLDYAKQYIVTKIQIAYLKAPSILVCDNIERMCKSLDRIDFQQHQLILVSEIISKFLKDQVKKYMLSGKQNVKFVFLSESKDSLNANIPKIVDLQVNLETANYSRRKVIFEYLEEVCGVKLDVDAFGSMTENFNLNEFFLLASKIYQEKSVVTHEEILEKINELSNKSFKSSKNFPKFEHVGGLYEVKDTIKETFEVPIKYEFLFKNIPIKLPRGVLLYGPPGCGKTYLAKATANELGLNFFSVKGPEILNKYIGASEQAVRDIFEKAYSVRPSIVFFDEFDAIVPRRNSGSTGVTDRVVNQFLCYLDGVASLEGVCILAASSRPDLIDPALLRPGRIDRHVYLGFPDESERRLIFGIFGKNLKMEEGLEIEDLVKGTANFTSADLVAFLKEIRIKMAHDMIEAKKLDSEFKFDFTLTREFLEKAYKVFRPSLNPKEIQKFEQMYAKFSDPKAVQDISKQKQTLI